MTSADTKSAPSKVWLDLDFYGNADPRVVEFLQANGLSAHDVLAGQVGEIVNDHLTLVVFDRDDQGRRVVDERTETFLKKHTTVPLTSPPEAHGLTL